MNNDTLSKPKEAPEDKSAGPWYLWALVGFGATVIVIGLIALLFHSIKYPKVRTGAEIQTGSREERVILNPEATFATEHPYAKGLRTPAWRSTHSLYGTDTASQLFEGNEHIYSTMG